MGTSGPHGPRGPHPTGTVSGAAGVEYPLVRLLGSGAMGDVFLAEPTDKTTGFLKRVAVKLIRLAHARDPAAVAQFLREAEVMKQVSHPNVIRILEVGEQAGAPFIAMEYLTGRPLNELLDDGEPLPTEIALQIGCKVAAGLGAIHARGIVHRDIKPANVFVTDYSDPLGWKGRWEIKVLDLGIAKPMIGGSTLTATGRLVGTPPYMSPEQANAAKDLDHRTDLWSLGVLLYQLTTGQRPFRGDSLIDLLNAILEADPPVPPIELNGQLPAALSALVVQLLAKDRADRPRSATEVGGRLRGILARPNAPSGTVVLATAGRAAPPPLPGPPGAAPSPGGSLPPVPDDVLEAEARIDSLQKELAACRAETHPNLADARAALARAGDAVRRLEADLHEAEQQLPGTTARTLAEAFRDDPDAPGAALRLAVPGVATPVVLPVIDLHKRLWGARHQRGRAKEAYQSALEAERDRLRGELRAAHEALERRQREDFAAVVRDWFARLGADEFPYLEWSSIEPELMARRYQFATDANELLGAAEALFDYDAAVRTGTPEALGQFLKKKHAAGPLADEARQRIARAETLARRKDALKVPAVWSALLVAAVLAAFVYYHVALAPLERERDRLRAEYEQAVKEVGPRSWWEPTDPRVAAAEGKYSSKNVQVAGRWMVIVVGVLVLAAGTGVSTTQAVKKLQRPAPKKSARRGGSASP